MEKVFDAAVSMVSEGVAIIVTEFGLGTDAGAVETTELVKPVFVGVNRRAGNR